MAWIWALVSSIWMINAILSLVAGDDVWRIDLTLSFVAFAVHCILFEAERKK